MKLRSLPYFCRVIFDYRNEMTAVIFLERHAETADVPKGNTINTFILLLKYF